MIAINIFSAQQEVVDLRAQLAAPAADVAVAPAAPPAAAAEPEHAQLEIRQEFDEFKREIRQEMQDLINAINTAGHGTVKDEVKVGTWGLWFGRK